jgi:hypothetical protein
MRRLLLCLVLASAAAPAYADDPKGPNPEGDYGGVEPGKPKKADPNKKPKKPPPKGTLSWIGFEAKDGGSQVFLQSVAPFEVSQRMDGSTLVVSLSGVTRLGSNTWRPIDTRYFETTLARISAKKKGRGIEVRIAFKNPKDAGQGSVSSKTEADGMYYQYLSFTGTAPPPAGPAPGVQAPAPVQTGPQDVEK